MRKRNSIYNILSTLASYFFVMIFKFITQSFIIRELGIEYSGVNGLFTNILTMLSVVELGIGTTVIFKLYKPIADNDIEKIKSWMNFYKECYRYVAIFIIIVGLLLCPVVPLIVGKVSINDNIIILYLISLLDTILSYCMTYKRSILYASQKNYIINVIHMGYTVFMNITQIILLVLFKNYVLFLIIKLIYRLIENIVINLMVDKKYPFLNESFEKIDYKEKKDVFNRVKSLFLQKISFVVNKGIDNIILSMFLGIISVGYYSNYYLVVAAITEILYQISSSLTASVGNLLTENNINKSYDIYKKINMFNSFITGISVIGFTCAIQPFICLWVGEKYLLSTFTVISFSIYIYSDSIRRAITLYKEAAGICREDRYMYVIMALINLITSVILCKIIGISGVILGTAISYFFLILYSYPKYIYIPLFKRGYIDYYKNNIKYIIFMIVSVIISFIMVNFISINSYILQFIVNITIAIIIGILVFILMFFRDEEFKYYLNSITNFISKVKNK